MPREYRHIEQYEKEILELRERGLTKREIGEKLGYRTPRYFSKLFYEYMKCYPNEYRKTLLKDGRENDCLLNIKIFYYRQFLMYDCSDEHLTT